jgi:cyclic pyranopterin phosphate synthase
MRRRLARRIKSYVGEHASLRAGLVQIQTSLELARNTAAFVFPSLIRPSPRFLTVAITSSCNLRCVGCRYGRDYMPGAKLQTSTVCTLLDDAAEAGMSTVRLYGGEPLLHPGLPQMVRTAVRHGFGTYVTTNGLLLDRRIDELVDAGLRRLTIGYYGFGANYEDYVGRSGAFAQLEKSVAATRDRYGLDIELQINFLLCTRTCSIAELRRAWAFAQRYQLKFQVDLIHYSLPYFTEGSDRELQFFDCDRERIQEVVSELLAMREANSSLYPEPVASIRSIPDWLLRGHDMRVSCDAYNMIWIGADGSVRLCYVTFPLGNVNQSRLRDLLFTSEHKAAAIDAFKLNCPGCHCGRSTRISKHLPSVIRYGVGYKGPPAAKPVGTPLPHRG